MVDAGLVYVVGVLVLFFFWIYGIVAFVRDVKNWIVPAYRQWRGDGSAIDVDDRSGGAGAERTPPSRKVDE